MAVSDRIAALINATNGINADYMNASPFHSISVHDQKDEGASKEGWFNLANIDQIKILFA